MGQLLTWAAWVVIVLVSVFVLILIAGLLYLYPGLWALVIVGLFVASLWWVVSGRHYYL
jgi:hypothetical protein